jgi:hypothetical protein
MAVHHNNVLANNHFRKVRIDEDLEKTLQLLKGVGGDVRFA